MFLDEGKWPIIGGWTAASERRLDQKAMARTLSRIADKGAAEFYTGDVARELVKDIRAKGGCLSAEDLASYRAEIVEPLVVPYRGGRIYAAPGLTGGPTLAHCLDLLSQTLKPHAGIPGAHSYVAYARALDAAWRGRLEQSGDETEAPHAPTCTTHFSIVDRDGNMCAVTQTLLSIFGSRVVAPTTGLLMNNGIMWFDPEPGKPNSLAPGKRCLANYCPVVGEAADGRRYALGASGGRKILGTVLQISSFLLDHGLSLEEAFHQQRIDMSGGDAVIADGSLPAEVIGALEAVFSTTLARRMPFPYHFAVPAGVLRQNEMNMGCTEIMSPWGDAVAERVASEKP
jgi:gamma-glutamyltranspeptidase / glutathione hydrolase